MNVDNAASLALEGGATGTPPIRLWLVDDNDRLRNTVAELLTRIQGIECARSFSSATALLSALASKAGPDVILLDIQMGNENGLDAVRPIKSLSRSLDRNRSAMVCRARSPARWPKVSLMRLK